MLVPLLPAAVAVPAAVFGSVVRSSLPVSVFRVSDGRVVLDYRCNLGKFNFRNFEEVETGRVLQLVHHVGKEVGTEIAVTVEFQKFAVFLRRYGLEFPVFIHAFHCADCLFLLIQYKKNIHHLFVSGGLAGCVYIHNFLNFSE